MARRIEVEARFTAKDNASPQIAKVEGRFKRLTNTIKTSAVAQVAALGGVVIALRSMVRGFAAVVRAAQTQEDAINKLDGALASLGPTAERVSKALQEQAAQLQRVSTFGDETIIEAQALIAAFVKEEDAIKAATVATLDLAAAKGFDLVQAADLISKTIGSSTNALSRYGIEVEGAVGSTERLESLTTSVAKLYGGRALKDTETFSGAMKQLGGAFGDVLEIIGDFIIKNDGLVDSIGNLTKFLLNNSSAFRQFGEVVVGTLGFIGKALGFLATPLILVTKGFTFLGQSATQLFQGTFREGEVAIGALTETAARLGITVEELRIRIDSVGGAIGNVKVKLDTTKTSTDALAEANKRLAASAAGDAANALIALGQALGVVTSAQLEQEIVGIESALLKVAEAGVIGANQFIELERIAGEKVDVLKRRIQSLKDGMGDLTISTVEAATEYTNLGVAFAEGTRAAVAADDGLQRLTRTTDRLANSTLALQSIQGVVGGGSGSTISTSGLSEFGSGGGRVNLAGGGSVLIRKDGRGGTVTPAQAVSIARTSTASADGKVA